MILKRLRFFLSYYLKSVTTNRLERSAGSSVGIAMTTLLVTTSPENVRENAKMAGLEAFAMKVRKIKLRKYPV